MNKKNYVVYSLGALNSYSRYSEGVIPAGKGCHGDFGWFPSYYTKDTLARSIAYQIVTWGKSEFLEKSVDNICAISPRRIIRQIDYGFLGIRSITDYEHRYFLGKVVKDEVVKLNVHELYEDVQRYIERITERRNKEEKKRKYKARSQAYKFREGSVPHISHYKWHNGCYYRKPKLGMVKKLNSDVDTAEFASAKYRTKNLPVWDDRVRHLDRSWKTSCRVKKQWMKHLSSHVDTE